MGAVCVHVCVCECVCVHSCLNSPLNFSWSPLNFSSWPSLHCHLGCIAHLNLNFILAKTKLPAQQLENAFLQQSVESGWPWTFFGFYLELGCSPWVATSRTRLSDFIFTFHFHALEEEMATHSRILVWRIPGTGEPGGLPSTGSHRVGHDWSDLAAVAAAGMESKSGLSQGKTSTRKQREPSASMSLASVYLCTLYVIHDSLSTTWLTWSSANSGNLDISWSEFRQM